MKSTVRKKAHAIVHFNELFLTTTTLSDFVSTTAILLIKMQSTYPTARRFARVGADTSHLEFRRMRNFILLVVIWVGVATAKTSQEKHAAHAAAARC